MNLFDIKNLPSFDAESFETLLQNKNIEIKKIISNTLKTPNEFISSKDEFVVLQKCNNIKNEKKYFFML